MNYKLGRTAGNRGPETAGNRGRYIPVVKVPDFLLADPSLGKA